MEFACVLPEEVNEGKIFVLSSSLQIEWTLSQACLCTATVTSREVAEHYINAPVVKLPPQPLGKQTIQEKGINRMPEKNKWKKLEGKKS